jgi:hypothetical protein
MLSIIVTTSSRDNAQFVCAAIAPSTAPDFTGKYSVVSSSIRTNSSASVRTLSLVVDEQI